LTTWPKKITDNLYIYFIKVLREIDNFICFGQIGMDSVGRTFSCEYLNAIPFVYNTVTLSDRSRVKNIQVQPLITLKRFK